jgi:ankyrin repeat protein
MSDEPLNKKILLSETVNQSRFIPYSQITFTHHIRSKDLPNIKAYLKSINIKENEYNILFVITRETLFFSVSFLKELIEFLNSYQINFNIKNNVGNTLLSCAVLDKNIPFIESLIALKEDINLDINESVPLNIAVINNNMYITKLLLDNGADVDKMSADDNTSLMLASYQHNLEIFNYILTKNPNILAKNKRGWNSLMWACDNSSPNESGNSEIISILIQKGSELNEKNILGETALNLIATDINEYSSLHMLLLLDAGADPNIPNNKGNTPLLTLANDTYTQFTYQTISMMILLLNNNANINHRNNYNKTIYNLMSLELNQYFQICNTFTRKNINNKIFCNRECLICIEKSNKMILLDYCNHIVICFECFVNYMKHNATNTHKCPFCSSPISTYKIVDFIGTNEKENKNNEQNQEQNDELDA